MPPDRPEDKLSPLAQEKKHTDLSELIDEEIRIILEGKEFPLTTEGDRELAMEKVRGLNSLRELLPVLIRNQHITEKLDREFLGECLETLFHAWHEDGGSEHPAVCVSALQKKLPHIQKNLKTRWRQN